MVFRIDSMGSAGGQWVGGGPLLGVRGTIIAPDWLNVLQEELVGLVESEGLSPSRSTDQVLSAVLSIAARVAGAELDFTAGSALTAGQPLLSGDAFGVVKATVAMGDPAVLVVRGRHVLPATSGDTMTLHQLVYWDAGAGEVTTTAAGNRVAGVAAAAKAPGETSVEVLLSGPPNV